MEKNKSLAHACYLLGALLFVMPLYDAVLRIWPLQLGDERWRFQAIGGLSSITLVPLIGLLIGLLAAAYLGSGRARRSIGVFCVALALVVAILAALFIMDYFRVRSIFPTQVQHAAVVASTMAVLKFVATIAVLVLLGLAGFDRGRFDRA